MDPSTIQMVGLAVTSLAIEATKTIGSDVIKGTWEVVRKKIGWDVGRPIGQLPQALDQMLRNNNALLEDLLAELRKQDIGFASLVLNQLDASQRNQQTAGGDINTVTMHGGDVHGGIRQGRG